MILLYYMYINARFWRK